MKVKGPDYLVIDNFMEVFGLPKELLLEAKNEGNALSNAVMKPNSKSRQEFMAWLKGLDGEYAK